MKINKKQIELYIEMNIIEKEYQSLNTHEEFNWSLVPKLEK